MVIMMNPNFIYGEIAGGPCVAIKQTGLNFFMQKKPILYS